MLYELCEIVTETQLSKNEPPDIALLPEEYDMARARTNSADPA